MKYIVKINDQDYTVEIQDLHKRPIIAFVNGTPVEVWPEVDKTPKTPGSGNEMELPGNKIMPPPVGAPTGGSRNFKYVRAPIPGVILNVSVQTGQEVIVGQELCIIEAMKMRNAIRAARAGVIAGIFIQAGQSVNHNDLLFEYDD